MNQIDGNSDMAMNASVSGSALVNPTDRAVCWTVLHHLKYTENNSKLSLHEIEGLSLHTGNAIAPADLAIVEETINAHYPELLSKVRENMWGFRYGEIFKLFNKKEEIESV